jgi:putative membrane protein
MRHQLVGFLIRLVVSSIALYVCVSLFGETKVANENAWLFVIAGLIFSVVNTVLKPVLTVFALPFIILTLGLFTLVINGLLVYVAIALTPGLEIGFWGAVWSGVIMSVSNYAINVLIGGIGDDEDRGDEALV